MCTTASVYEGAENWPNLYAGAFSVMLLILFVLNKRINWKQKNSSSIVCVAFSWQALPINSLTLYGTDCIFRIRCLADSRICMHFLY